ncbi:MAG: TonB-dependent receptor [Gammaproteobacteria bacterium]
MFQKNKLYTAIAGAVAIGATGTAHAQLEEILVTATKRAESTQDIAVSVQALGGESLKELGVSTFDEYVKYLPNVVQQGRGPGRSEIYIRGVATEQSGNTVSSVQGSSPAVAMYLDEQPVSFGGRNLDVYAADLERVEVLPGPQGTLFGASSQSGTVRLITNKPVQGEFQAGFDAGFGFTTGGDPSSNLEGFINIPLTEKLAFRGVIYNDNQGGWIDNVAGGFNPDDQELINVINRNQISGAAEVLAGADVQRSNNSDLIEDNWNKANYKGLRASLAYDINEDWDLLVQHTAQQLETQGVWEYAPVLGGNEESQSFSPDENNDDFGLTTWTLQGRIKGLDVVYTGGFLDREVYQISDYTLYTFGGGYQVYYITTGGYSTADTVYDFRKQYVDNTSNERMTHELRFQTDADKRLRGTFGLFIDDSQTESVGEFQYFGAVDAGFDVANQAGDGTVEGTTDNFGHGQNTIFVNDFTRKEDQFAIFADASFDITDTLTFSAGFRNYDIDFALLGHTGSSFSCKGVDPTTLPTSFPPPDANGRIAPRQIPRPDGTPGCDAFNGNNVTARLRDQAALEASGAAGFENLDANGVANESDTIWRATLDWTPMDDLLLFVTWSEGFRPLVSNRNAGVPSGNQQGVFEGYVVPAVAVTDELTNIEFGMKGEFLSNRLRLNATYYNSEIKNLQTTRFDPSNIAFLVFIENVGDADIQGIDMDLAWAATDSLTISGALGWVDSEITRLNQQLEGIAVPVGSELPFTADFSFNLRARYDWQLTGFGADAFFQAGVAYTGDSKAGIVGNAYLAEDTTRRIYGVGSGLTIADEGGSFGATRVATEVPGSQGLITVGGEQFFRNGRYVQEAYTLFNLSAGIKKDNWGAEVFIDNVGDQRGAVHISTFDYVPTVTTSRPRTMGLRFSYDFQ